MKKPLAYFPISLFLAAAACLGSCDLGGPPGGARGGMSVSFVVPSYEAFASESPSGSSRVVAPQTASIELYLGYIEGDSSPDGSATLSECTASGEPPLTTYSVNFEVFASTYKNAAIILRDTGGNRLGKVSIPGPITVTADQTLSLTGLFAVPVDCPDLMATGVDGLALPAGKMVFYRLWLASGSIYSVEAIPAAGANQDILVIPVGADGRVIGSDFTNSAVLSSAEGAYGYVGLISKNGSTCDVDLGIVQQEHPNHVVINELRWENNNIDGNNIQIEILNPTDSAVDLSQMRIACRYYWGEYDIRWNNINNKQYYFPSGTIVPKGGYLVLTTYSNIRTYRRNFIDAGSMTEWGYSTQSMPARFLGYRYDGTMITELSWMTIYEIPHNWWPSPSKDINGQDLPSHIVWPSRNFWRDADGDGTQDEGENLSEYVEAYIPIYNAQNTAHAGGIRVGGQSPIPDEYKAFEYNWDGTPILESGQPKFHYRYPQVMMYAGVMISYPAIGYRTGMVNCVNLRDSSGNLTWNQGEAASVVFALTLERYDGTPLDYVAVGGNAIVSPAASWTSDPQGIPKRSEGILERIYANGSPLDTDTPLDWRYDGGTLGLPNDSHGLASPTIILF